MKSKALTVDSYLREVPEKRSEALKKLRELCLKHLPDHEEGMVYNMPSYVKNGQVQVAFASQKQHICIYFLIHEVMLANEDRLRGLNRGKGCIRYSNPSSIDFELIAFLLQESLRLDGPIC